MPQNMILLKVSTRLSQDLKPSPNVAVKPSERLKINNSEDAEKLFRSIWSQSLELKECFYALYFNRANKVLGYLLLSLGGISGTVIDLKCVYQAALKANASVVIIICTITPHAIKYPVMLTN
jgi:DNA repair protein RadC